MDIKLKRLARAKWLKIAAFVVLTAFSGLFIMTLVEMGMTTESWDPLSINSYYDSGESAVEMRGVAERLAYLLKSYGNRDYITSGQFADSVNLWDYYSMQRSYEDYLNETGYGYDTPDNRELFLEERKDTVQAIKNKIKASALTEYDNMMERIESLPDGIVYYATYGDNVLTNVKESSASNKAYYKSRPAYYLYDDEGVEAVPNGRGQVYYTYGYDTSSADIEMMSSYPGVRAYVAITDEGMTMRVNNWDSDRNMLQGRIGFLVFYGIAAVCCFIYLIAVTGRVPDSHVLAMNFIDKLYTDINAGLIIFGIVMYVMFAEKLLSGYQINGRESSFGGILMLTAGFAFVLELLLLSLVRHIKEKSLIRHTLVYTVVHSIFSVVVRVFAAGPLLIKAIVAEGVLVVVAAFSLLIPPFMLVTIPAVIYVLYRKVAAFRNIQTGVKNVKSGNYDYKIEPQGRGEFRELAEDINTITEGLNTAVQNQVKSERLKTELITNVSHDIKTPLTSIITYVDLLKREGLGSENAGKYLDVLDRKANRLKTLTEDLFEAAKATSGSIAVNIECVNLGSLLSQIMGEMDEKIQNSGLDFRINMPEGKVHVAADGRHLCRVIENLFSNVFKYAMKGSRVYIEVREEMDTVTMCMKNVSAYELNIPVSELTERFKRGDESRNSEGNGLGLAIAKSLIELQKGTLTISVDGDLFKAEIQLQRADAPKQREMLPVEVE